MFTEFIAAAQLSCLKLQTDGDAMPGQVGASALVVTMKASRRLAALRATGLRLNSSHDEDNAMRFRNDEIKLDSRRVSEQSRDVHAACYSGLPLSLHQKCGTAVNAEQPFELINGNGLRRQGREHSSPQKRSRFCFDFKVTR